MTQFQVCCDQVAEVSGLNSEFHTLVSDIFPLPGAAEAVTGFIRCGFSKRILRRRRSLRNLFQFPNCFRHWCSEQVAKLAGVMRELMA